MPVTFTVGGGIVCVTVQGTVTHNELLDTFGRALAKARKARRPASGADWNLIIDISASTARRTEDELRGIAMALTQHSDLLTGRVAVVAVDSLREDRGRLFSTFAEQLGHEPRVFHSLAEAQAWLAPT
jgi:hypothetical protein